MSQRLDPDDPVLSCYAEFANVPPEAFDPPATIVELAVDAALEREDAPELLLDELYQVRQATPWVHDHGSCDHHAVGEGCIS